LSPHPVLGDRARGAHGCTPSSLSRAGRRHCCVRISAVQAINDFAASAASDRDAVLARCEAFAKDLDTVPEIASALQIPVNNRKLAAAPRASGVLRCSTQARVEGPIKDNLVEKLLQHDADAPRAPASARTRSSRSIRPASCGRVCRPSPSDPDFS